MQKKLTIAVDERVYEGLYLVIDRRRIRSAFNTGGTDVSPVVANPTGVPPVPPTRVLQPLLSRFIESLVRPCVVGKDLDAAYAQMAQDEAREKEALDWAEGTTGDVADETG